YQVDFATLPDAGAIDLGSIRLVFQRDQWPGPQYLWSISADGSGVRQLTTGVVLDFEPDVSPDGSRIAFSRWVPPSGVDWTSPDLEIVPQIFVMNVDGTGVTQLTQGPARAYGP